MINIESEQLIGLTDAAKIVPSRPSLRTVFRWALKGYGPQKLKLETLKVGQSRMTSREAIHRFIAKINEDSQQRPSRTKTQRTRIDAAKRRLAQDGI
ncbi:MAG: DUF1580 domain-containing protein [Pirellulaceae bacterium]